MLTAQAYDLWKHNCNTFSHDFAMFLVGKGIPEHITNLPDEVLQSPIGRMIKPMIDDKIRAQKQRQAGLLGLSSEESAKAQPRTSWQQRLSVKLPVTIADLDRHLESAKDNCAVIFFTSATCGPCRPLHPVYEEIAKDVGPKAAIIKVDIGRSQDTAAKYNITATPTFVTFFHGAEDQRWVGADVNQLRSKIKTLVTMAWPPHPHDYLHVPAFRNVDLKPVLYNKVPPIEKVMLKIGAAAKNPAVRSVQTFIVKSRVERAANTPVPDLDGFSHFIQNAVRDSPQDVMFAIVDLLRVIMVDPRISGYFAEQQDHKTILALLEYINNQETPLYSLRLVGLQTACNIFSSPLYTEHILNSPLTQPLVQLATTCLLDEAHHNLRIAASSFTFNLAVANSQQRTIQMRNLLPEEQQVELAASLLEAITLEEQSPEALKGFLLALGHLVWCVDLKGELVDMLRTMDADKTVLGKAKDGLKEPLIDEIGGVLLVQRLKSD